ncbi:hypothetical protein GF380_04620 [Candidatus Uhrbacteria bacterium]|nr:hypothetical protein [Candidatus Uhrbacteria bacterium]MBD3284339.1 hypothetical protein [Candidatus Uhrbacteria bacterium]
MKKLIYLLFGIALLVPGAVSAAEFKAEENVQLGPDPITQNVYAAGGNVIVSSPIEGDAHIAGGMVNISGDVRQDLSVAGGNVSVLGNVGQDLRVVGGNLTVNGSIGGEAILIGGTVQIIDGEVNGDLVVLGGMVIINGKLNRNLVIKGGEVQLNATVEGVVTVEAAESFNVGKHAVVKTPILYKGTKEAVVADGAILEQGIQYEQMEQGRMSGKTFDKKELKMAFGGFLTALFFLKLFIMILTAFILVALIPGCLNDGIKRSLKDYWIHLLYGLVVLVVAPVAILLLLATILGSLFGILLGLVFGLLLIVAKILAALLIGVWLIKILGKKKDVPLNWKPILLGVLVMEFVWLIPILGWIAVCIFFLSALGALSMHGYEMLKKMQK